MMFNRRRYISVCFVFSCVLPLFSQPLQIEDEGTPNAYFSYHGKPLLSFGGMSDFLFYAAEDAFDYRQWADWQHSHGMNHCRAYLPGSYTYVEKFTKENGGKKENILFPYRETTPGSRQFDLTQFDERYWQRFRKQCAYLASKDIIIDLLMWNGWQLSNYNPQVADQDWNGHFFNPKNNINGCTDHLNTDTDPSARLKFYHSVADGNQELLAIQKAYFEKIIEMTHDLENIYYEIVHEIAINYENWPKTSQWLDNMATTIKRKWRQYHPERKIILSTDAGHLAGHPFNYGGGYPQTGSEMDQVFANDHFNVLIDGNHHHVTNLILWKEKYLKPVVAQESRDDSGQTWSYRIPGLRNHLRKYVWKMMMAKCQQIDIYTKPQPTFLPVQRPAGPSNNYDPNGWNKFEDDALLLREFFDQIRDYPSLKHQGYFWISTVGHNMVLSSDQEIIAYMSSPTGIENMTFTPKGAHVFLYDLPFPDGEYPAYFFDPKTGPAGMKLISIEDGITKFRTQDFVDDLVVHILRE